MRGDRIPRGILPTWPEALLFLLMAAVCVAACRAGVAR